MNLYMAGCEVPVYRTVNLFANNPNMLVSYYHLTGGKHKMPAEFVREYHQIKDNTSFIMDSGLFTMMFGAGKHNKYTATDLHDYTDRYLANINAMKYEDYIVEMDVHKILGIQELQAFRDKFVQRYDINKVIFVWHVEEKIEGWEEMARTYPYIALSIPELRIVMKRNHLKSFTQKMIRKALLINPEIKIHLLGCTSNDLLEQSGYYSADSTSWQASLRFGSFKVPHNKKEVTLAQMKMLADQKEETIEYNKQLVSQKYGIKPKKNTPAGKSYTDRGILSVAFYRFMAENINRDYYDRGYPVFDTELKPIIGRNK